MLEPQPPRSLRDRRQLSTMRRVSPVGTALLLAVLVAVGGCATRADLERVKRDQQDMRARLADVQVSLDSINRRLDTMRSSMDDKGGGRDSATVRALEKRIADLETHTAAPPLPTETGAAAVPTPVERAAPNMPRTEAANIALRREDRAPANPANEAYRRALQTYRDGQADQAVVQFREYLRANPKSDLADNAQYWIGEAYYSKGDYNRAIIELNEVLLKYPQGDQVPGALLALATSFSNSGDKIDAKLILQKLISDHPKSEEAEIGRQQLQTLAD
jgi:tol-pal system protein YbgF